MAIIEQMKLRIAELYQELNRLEKSGYTPENLARVHEIEKQAKDLKMAISHKKKAIGLA